MRTRYTMALALSFLTLTVLTACAPARTAPDVTVKTRAEEYFRLNIGRLSPEPAQLGGTFYVTDITWEDATTAIISYEDGHIALRARARMQQNDDDTMSFSALSLIDENGQILSSAPSRSSESSAASVSSGMSSMSSVSSGRSSMAPSSGSLSSRSLSSVSSRSASVSSSSANRSSSTSASSRPQASLGEFCGGIAGFQCAAGLRCQMDGTYPDAGGTCVKE